MCCVLVLIAETVQGADTSGQKQGFQPRAFEAAVYNVETTGWQQMQRVAVAAGTNKFDFVAPYGLRLSANADLLTLASTNATYFLAFRILDTIGAEPNLGNRGNTDSQREYLLAQFPGANVIEEFSKTAASQTGPAYELRVKSAGDAERAVCVVFIPSAAGVLEFSCNAQPSKASEAKVAFNSLLRTFRSNQFGKLEILPSGPDNS